jgi:hypothetical protein
MVYCTDQVGVVMTFWFLGVAFLAYLILIFSGKIIKKLKKDGNNKKV